MCKKQSSVSHSSTESEIISLDACLSLDGLLHLDLWVVVIEVFRSSNSTRKPANPAAGNCSRDHKSKLKQEGNRNVDQVSHVNNVTTNANSSQGESQLYIFEDHEAGIKMIIKGSFWLKPFSLRPFVLAVAIPATVFSVCVLDYLSLVPVWFGRIGSRKIFWGGMRGDGFQTQKQKSWVSGQVRAERVLADAITIDGRKERICKFCSETNVWTRWRCRRRGNNILTGLQGKHKQAVYAKNEGWCSGSSSSSGGEEGKSQDQDEEIEKMRAHVELLRKQQRVGKRPEVQGEPT